MASAEPVELHQQRGSKDFSDEPLATPIATTAANFDLSNSPAGRKLFHLIFSLFARRYSRAIGATTSS
jgi:hypothetical protein